VKQSLRPAHDFPTFRKHDRIAELRGTGNMSADRLQTVEYFAAPGQYQAASNVREQFVPRLGRPGSLIQRKKQRTYP